MGQVLILSNLKEDIQGWEDSEECSIGSAQLSGKAAVWAVCKQKGHHRDLKRAMMHLDAVVSQK